MDTCWIPVTLDNSILDKGERSEHFGVAKLLALCRMPVIAFHCIGVLWH